MYASAPYGWKPNTNDGTPVFPPIPQDMHMKRSLLFLPDPFILSTAAGAAAGGSGSGGTDGLLGKKNNIDLETNSSGEIRSWI
jgi:hypothetical protein